MNKYFINWKECKEYLYADAFRYIGDHGEVKSQALFRYYIRHPNYRYVFWMRLAQYTYGRKWLIPMRIYIYAFTAYS